MRVEQKIVDRLDELIMLGEQVLATRFSRSSGSFIHLNGDGVDSELSHQFGVSSLSLLSRVFGQDSDHYKIFNGFIPKFDGFSPIKQSVGVLKAAKDDYEGGHLFETRTLIQAEVFDDFLEQAEHLLKSNYHQAAAVVAGCVLEDGLRKLCGRKNITLSAKPKLDTMNAELAKAGVYNVLTQKKITALADLRNKAAHGDRDNFTKQDVEQMLPQIRSFMENHFT